MRFNFDSFLWVGMTLAVFNRVGKLSVVNKKVTKSAS